MKYRNILLLPVILCSLFFGKAYAEDVSGFFVEEGVDIAKDVIDRLKSNVSKDNARTLPTIMNMSCTKDRWTDPRGPFNKWWNVKICCIDVGCCNKSDRHNYPDVESENCMRDKIREKIKSEIASIKPEEKPLDPKVLGGWTGCYKIFSLLVKDNRLHIRPVGKVEGHQDCPRTDIGQTVLMSTPPSGADPQTVQNYISIAKEAYNSGKSIRHRTKCIDNHSQYIEEIQICN